MSAVDEDGELDHFGSTEIDNGIERRADGATGVKNVVDEHNDFAGDVGENVGRTDYGLRLQSGEVVAIESDVENAESGFATFGFFDCLSEALSDGHAAGSDADQNDIVDAAIAFDDLMSDALNGAAHVVGLHYGNFFNEICHDNTPFDG